MKVGKNATVSRVVPGGPAERAGLYDGAEIIGVDGRRFSVDRMDDAVKGSVATRGIKLLMAEGDVLRDVQIDYADGPRYMTLVRDESKPDVLGAIIKPLAGDAAKKEPAAAESDAPKEAVAPAAKLGR